MKKEITMSIPQFCAYKRGEKTLKDIKIENGLESIANKIIKNEKVRKMAIFTIAGLNYASKVFADAAEATAKVDEAGRMLLGLVQSIGYWLCLIGCVMEILKCVMNGNSKEVGRIMLKYLLIFAALYLMPWAFDLIKGIFS